MTKKKINEKPSTWIIERILELQKNSTDDFFKDFPKMRESVRMSFVEKAILDYFDFIQAKLKLK